MSNEFSNDYNTYFSILQFLASGMTRISEIDGVLGKSSGVYLANLENNYEMISKVRPLFAKVGAKVSKIRHQRQFPEFLVPLRLSLSECDRTQSITFGA